MSHPNSPSPWSATGQGQQPGGQPPGAGQYGQPGNGSPWGASGPGAQHTGPWQPQGSAPQQAGGLGSAPQHQSQPNQGQHGPGQHGQPGVGSAPAQPGYGSAPQQAGGFGSVPQQPGYGSAPQQAGGFGGANVGMPMPESVGKKAKGPKPPKAPGAGLIGPLTLRDILLLVAGLFALIALATPAYAMRTHGMSGDAEWFVQRWSATTIGYVVLGALPVLAAAVLTLVNKLTGSMRLIGSLSVDQLISVLCAVALAMNVVWLATMAINFHVGSVFGVLAAIIAFVAGTLTVIPVFGKEFTHRPSVDAHPKARPYTKNGAAQTTQGPVVDTHGGRGSQPGAQNVPGTVPGTPSQTQLGDAGQAQAGSQPGTGYGPGSSAHAAPGQAPMPGQGSQPGSQFAPGQAPVPAQTPAPAQTPQSDARGRASVSQSSPAQGQPWSAPSGQQVTAGGNSGNNVNVPQGGHGQNDQGQKTDDTFHTSDDEQAYLGRHSAQKPRYAQNQPTQAFVTGGKENQVSDQPGGPGSHNAPGASSATGDAQKTSEPQKSSQPHEARDSNSARQAGVAGAAGVGAAGVGVAAGAAGAAQSQNPGAAQSQNPWAKPGAPTEAGREHEVANTSGAERDETAAAESSGDARREPDARGDARADVANDNEPTQYFRPYDYSEQGFEPVGESEAKQVAPEDQETQLSQAVQPQQDDEAHAQAPASEAFWFAVPEPRPAVHETTGETVFVITPGEWFLAVRNRGTSFVVHNSEQEEGILHNVTDVTLP